MIRAISTIRSSDHKVQSSNLKVQSTIMIRVIRAIRSSDHKVQSSKFKVQCSKLTVILPYKQ